MNKKQRRWRNRIVIALVIFFAVLAVEQSGLLSTLFGTPGDVYASFALFLVPYLIAGYKTLLEAARNIRRGDPFDEAFLMSVASLGAFAMVFFPDTDPHMAEGAAVMLFYQVGELFQSYAVGRSPWARRSWSSPASACPLTAWSRTARPSSTPPRSPASPSRATWSRAPRSYPAAST